MSREAEKVLEDALRLRRLNPSAQGTRRGGKMKTGFLAVAAAVGFVACATTGNEQVRITRNPQATSGCKFIQNVEASGGGGIEHMEKKLRDEGAKVGADLVYLPPRPERGFTIYGEAYRCSPSSAPPLSRKP